MEQSESTSQLLASAPNGYRVQRELKPGLSWLATAPDGRKVVLKILPETCLLQDQLHAEIRDRLERIRELPHVGVANFLGVEHDGNRKLAVWEHVPGTTLDAYAADHAGALPRSLACELVSAVQTLHALGLSHGAIHSRNVIITPTGAVRLTHLSPLLYLDHDIDVQGLLEVLPLLGCRQPLADLTCNSPMRALEQRVLAWARGGAGIRETIVEKKPSSFWDDRKLALAGALLTASAGLALTWGIVYFVRRTSPETDTQPPALGSSQAPGPDVPGSVAE
jgi:hypothetical protein